MPAEDLRALGVEILERVDVPADVAGLVSDCLIYADMRGVASHGVVRLPIYVERVRRGMVDAHARPHPDGPGDGPAVWIDARNALGALGASSGLEAAAEAARRYGAGIAGVRNSNHCGALGFYSHRGASDGLVVVAASNAPVTMAYFGGRTRAVGTNPLAMAFPRVGGPPIVLDIATSATARGKIIVAANEDRDIPPGWAVDVQGKPTTDAHAALEGAVLPFAGPKGSGLALVIDLLCGALTGAATGRHIGDMYENWQRPQNVGHLFIAIDPAQTPARDFLGDVEQFVEEVHGLPPGQGFEQVLLPGELEERKAAAAAREGVPIAESTLTSLLELADAVGADGAGLRQTVGRNRS